MSAQLMKIATREPGQRSADTRLELADQGLAPALEHTPRLLASLIGNAGPYIGADDINLVGRRALELILALRSWQLKHDGQLPDDLRSLVPNELASLPKDPYSSGSFVYVPLSGQRVQTFPSVVAERLSFRPSRDTLQPPGSRVLFSIIRPNHREDREMAPADLDHIGFVIPAIEPKVPAGKDKEAQETSKNKPTTTVPK
jgi:hypothetical protein